jgi:antitoxin HigA-1
MSIRREDVDAGRVDFGDVADPRRAPMRPARPGRVLKDEFLDPLEVSAYRLAKDINVPVNRIAAIAGGKRAITTDTALRLAQYFGTDAQSWINLQARYDLEVVHRASAKRISREVKPRAA